MFGAAGWLFAELALVLMITAIGSAEVAGLPPMAEAPPTASDGNGAPPTSPSPSPQPAPEQSLELVPKKFTIFVPPDGAGAVEAFRNGLLTTVGEDGRVGLVLLFGVARPSRPALAGGQEVSGLLKSLLAAEDIPQLRSAVEVRDYVGTDANPGEVRVELFQLVGGT